jgi:hypothetical protein
MSKGTLGSFNGTTTPNANMVEVFKTAEIEKHENSVLNFSPFMTLKKLGIQCEPGTVVRINDCDIPIPSSGVFELGFNQVDVTSIVFRDAVEISAYYMY